MVNDPPVPQIASLPNLTERETLSLVAAWSLADSDVSSASSVLKSVKFIADCSISCSAAAWSAVIRSMSCMVLSSSTVPVACFVAAEAICFAVTADAEIVSNNV